MGLVPARACFVGGADCPAATGASSASAAAPAVPMEQYRVVPARDVVLHPAIPVAYRSSFTPMSTTQAFSWVTCLLRPAPDGAYRELQLRGRGDATLDVDPCAHGGTRGSVPGRRSGSRQS